MVEPYDLNDLFFFAQVVEKGGFTRASRALGVPKSRLSRRVAGLEARLGVRLLQRTTRRLSLTDVGRGYYAQCQAMVSAARAAEESVLNQSSEPRGLLRVSAALGIAQHDLSPHWGAFLQKYPRVHLELLVTNRRVNLVEEGVDVALRVRRAGEEDPGLVTRRLRRSRGVVVAAPRLLEAHPKVESPEDLKLLPALGFGSASQPIHWALTGPGGAAAAVEVRPRMHADDFVVLKSAAVDGAGVTLLPETSCSPELERGLLLPVLPGWYQTDGILHAVYPSSRGLSPSVRAFVDFLVERVVPPKRARPPGPDGATARQPASSIS